MKRPLWVAAIVGISVLALACANGTPTTPRMYGAVTGPPSLGESAGLQKTTISGGSILLSLDPIERRFVTPSGITHGFNLPEHVQYTGDIEGVVTFHADPIRSADGTHLITHGPFEGEITFKGRTGTITGQWTTNCKWDAAIGNLSCDGVMNFRGAGDLEGVLFHMEWGPGWWPLPYTGTAWSPW